MTPVPDAPLARHAGRFSRLALANVTRAYPNSPAHLLAGPDELLEPRAHHPAFYGAYDWHSAVHMHWLLVRLLRRCPGHVDTAEVTAVLDAHLTPRTLAVEADYLRDHPGFERPYGWAWLLALTAEVAALPERPWAEALRPAARVVAGLLTEWLPKALYPVRHGTHANSAFALGLVLDHAQAAAVPELAAPVAARLRSWFADDHDAPLHWEPSGQDFLSPALCEADAMRRVLTPGDFAAWLTRFLPALAATGGETAFPRPRVSDPADPQIGHLLGLCLSRAAAARRVAAALPSGDARVSVLRETAAVHLDRALPATASGDFTTDHWLATFAALALES